MQMALIYVRPLIDRAREPKFGGAAQRARAATKLISSGRHRSCGAGRGRAGPGAGRGPRAASRQIKFPPRTSGAFLRAVTYQRAHLALN